MGGRALYICLYRELNGLKYGRKNISKAKTGEKLGRE
jgi:hypothetical protein